MTNTNTIKGIQILTYETDTWNIKELILGKVFPDRSFEKCIRLYNDENNIFQMQFLMGNNIAYSFLPECTELLDTMKEGLVGISLKNLADILIEHDWKEVTEK